MLRTRDLALFFAILLGLLLAIFVTLMFQGGETGEDQAVRTAAENSEYTVEVTEEADERASFLDRLRSKLGTQSVPEPDLALADQAETVEEAQDSSAESATTTDKLAPQICSDDSYQTLFQDWPTEDLAITNAEGVWVISELIPQATFASSTGTTTALVPRTILTLPPPLSATDQISCVPQNVIGVRADGGLLKNTDVILYRGYLPNELVGYALDGAQIYGPIADAPGACSTADLPNGSYQYHVTLEGEYVLPCFRNLPKP